MYEEQYFLDLLVSMANGYLSFRYSEYFLKHIRESRKLSISLWIVIYSAGQLLFSYICDIYAIHDRFIQIVIYALLILFLQKVFFEENRLRQIFVIASFIAGWDILRFLASPMAHAIFNAWSPLWIRLVESFVEFNNFSMETITNGMLIVNRIVVFVVLAICRGVQLGLFSLYLKLITKNFTVADYGLNIQESIFLTFPCITVIFIDLTMRLMAYSVDNSEMMLIYERVPSTLILLPLVSLLLLGIVISSVILFIASF